MRVALNVTDELLERSDWLQWQAMARQLEYRDAQHPRDEHIYKNVGVLPEGWTLATQIAEALSVPSINMRLEFLRLGEPNDGAGNIHCDDGDGAWASVFYLNTNEELRTGPTGTAFWQHRWLGKDYLPEGIEPEVIERINADRYDADRWEPIHAVPARENRLIVYPTQLFHSRWPLEPKAGRIVHVGFFDIG